MRDESPRVAYKGYSISYDERDDTWEAYIGSEIVCKPKLSEVKRYIDRLDRKGFTRFEAYVGRFMSGKIEISMVTSVLKEYGRLYCWVITDGRRNKFPASSVYPKNPENDKLMEQINDLEQKIVQCREQQTALKNHLQSYEAIKAQEKQP